MSTGWWGEIVNEGGDDMYRVHVPEPSSILFALAGLGFAIKRRFRK